MSHDPPLWLLSSVWDQQPRYEPNQRGRNHSESFAGQWAVWKGMKWPNWWEESLFWVKLRHCGWSAGAVCEDSKSGCASWAAWVWSIKLQQVSGSDELKSLLEGVELKPIPDSVLKLRSITQTTVVFAWRDVIRFWHGMQRMRSKLDSEANRFLS